MKPSARAIAFLIALRKHAPGKWRKAVGELVKAVYT